MTPRNILDYRGQAFINFRDHMFADRDAHGYRWVDIKRFDLRSPSVDDRALLAAVIHHEQFRDNYAGGGVDPNGTRHGSYWLNQISTGSFDLVDEPTSTAVLTAWAHQHWKSTGSTRAATPHRKGSSSKSSTGGWSISCSPCACPPGSFMRRCPAAGQRAAGKLGSVVLLVETDRACS